MVRFRQNEEKATHLNITSSLSNNMSIVADASDMSNVSNLLYVSNETDFSESEFVNKNESVKFLRCNLVMMNKNKINDDVRC
jgi:hypothetical protein